MSKDNETKKSLFNQHLGTSDAYFADYDFDAACKEDEAAERRREQMKETVCRLEQRFADRGLMFTQDFAGALPMQAFGTIDGMRFYFRFRYDAAVLRVGTLDPEKPLRDYDRAVSRRVQRITKLERAVASGEITQKEADAELKWFREPRIEYPNGRDDYPTLIKKQARISSVLNQEWAGVLTAEEAEKVFTELVESLEDVDYDLSTFGVA